MTTQFNKEYLEKYCKDNNISIISILTNKIDNKNTGPKPREITRDTIIKGKCTNNNCINDFEKNFRNLIEKNSYCKKCAKVSANLKREETCMQKYGEKHVTKVLEIKAKSEETCIKKYGTKHPLQSHEILNKSKETLLKNYGVVNPSQSKIVQGIKKQQLINTDELKYSITYLQELINKDKASLLNDIDILDLTRNSLINFLCFCSTDSNKTFRNIENFGARCDNCQTKHALDKSIKTNMEKRNVPYPSMDPNVINKMKATNKEKYGVENPQQLLEIRNKTKKTCINNMGVEYPMQSKTVQETAKNNNFIKYGVNHPMQIAEIADKCSKNSYSKKDYMLPSGKIIKIQGYEHYALDELVINYDEEDIINGEQYVPEIWYNDEENNKHRHYVDIFILSKNLCIEVKSTWTADKKKDNIFLKQDAAKKLGYEYEIWVYDGKGKKVNCFI